MFRIALNVIFCFIFFSVYSIAHAKRLALVIGINDYQSVSKLEKAVNDAEAVATTLRDLNFEVTLATDLKRRAMNLAIQDFAAQIESGDEVLFYYAGHGIEIRGRNYLLPADIPLAKPGREGFVTNEAFEVDNIIQVLQGRGSRLNILILDACRNNPFPKVGKRSLGASAGLGRIDPPRGTFVVFSAGFHQEALDRLSDEDRNPNSVFTRKLIPLIKTPGLQLTQLAKQLRVEVEELAKTVKHEQFPAFYDQVRGAFYFNPGNAAKQTISLATSADHILWKKVENSEKPSDFKFYLREYPKGLYSSVARLRLHQMSGPPEEDRKAEKKSSEDLRDVTIALQRELKRVGCDPGQIDGVWGRRGQSALARFSKHAKIKLSSKTPLPKTVEIVKSISSRVCPIQKKAKNEKRYKIYNIQGGFVGYGTKKCAIASRNANYECNFRNPGKGFGTPGCGKWLPLEQRWCKGTNYQ